MTQKKILTAEERRKRNHAEMVEDTLAIAREMMQADGVAALSFNAIARRLGIKPPSLYTYFASKHAVYDALFRRGFEEFPRQMEQAVDREHGFEEFLRSLLEAYMVFALENADLFQLMFQRPVPGFTPSDESMAVSLGSLRHFRQELQDMLERCGIETTSSIEQTSDLIIALMYGLAALQLANNPNLPVGEGRFGSLIENAVQMLLKALT
jgi:AcrR family transcriptional regulator